MEGCPLKLVECQFTNKMIVHSLMDIRHFLKFLLGLMRGTEIYHQHINSRLVHCRLKHFWNYTKQLRKVDDI